MGNIIEPMAHDQPTFQEICDSADKAFFVLFYKILTMSYIRQTTARGLHAACGPLERLMRPAGSHEFFVKLLAPLKHEFACHKDDY